MSFITEPLYDFIEFENKTYTVTAAFDIVLNVQRLYREKALSDWDKLNKALELLCPDRKVKLLEILERVKLLNMIYDTQIKTKPRPRVGKPMKVVDFEQDGEYIYASFLQDYKIDLIDVQGKLHWQKFIALFQGLSEQTKIKQIMQIRGREIPAPTKYNQEEIKSLMELKAYYALDYAENNGQKGLSLLFSTLERMATV